MRTEPVTKPRLQATGLLSDIKRDKAPIMITRHDLPIAYLVDVGRYERMQQRICLFEGITRGERAIAEGRIATHSQAKSRLARWLK